VADLKKPTCVTSYHAEFRRSTSKGVDKNRVELQNWGTLWTGAWLTQEHGPD